MDPFGQGPSRPNEDLKTEETAVKNVSKSEGKGKGKDVDLYSALHAPGTPNAHVTETRPPDRHLGHRPACNTQPVQ